MAGGLRLSQASHAWGAFGAFLGVAALLAWSWPSIGLDWQPQLAATEPWRAWSAAFVHWSRQHLWANLLACAVVTWFGWGARVPSRCAWAWFIAWPLTQLALLLQPTLLHFGGLSGVLHAGVAVVLVELLARQGRERLIGAGVTLGLLVKLWQEQPLGPPMRQMAEWDIAVVPFSHLTGALAGALSALGLLCLARRRA
ncbi:rhombosortase [Roseateles oligotrophus]|uniref:Rhombosortase n=1 Tax=Roseateles oligotrophus TaxID=1769250 RepID=A0ABT2YJW4_9BURK|nr:rhombosortase [Roseateles oligotrophus]MCV2370346.1 rhombosortase [Roseateles oligotrophus]